MALRLDGRAGATAPEQKDPDQEDEHRAKDVSTVARLAEHCEGQAKLVADMGKAVDRMTGDGK